MNNKLLKKIMEKLNKIYFNNKLSINNIKFNCNSKKIMAYYHIKQNTIIINNCFKNSDEETLGFLIYHEMVHKKVGIKYKNGRRIYHGKEFKEWIKKVPGHTYKNQKLELVFKKNKGVIK